MAPTAVLEPVLAFAPAVVDDDGLYEIIDGKRVEGPPMSIKSVRVATKLVGELLQFNKTHNLGEPVIEMLFRLPLERDRRRRPDVAFVSFTRWAKGRVPENDNAWEVAPDLAVEVVSPTDRAEDVMEKVLEYFQAGVELVWIIYPRLQLVYVYESLIKVRGLTAADTLDGGNVLPGFRTPVAALFPETAPPM
jgi:Uma2 family endonuclease